MLLSTNLSKFRTSALVSGKENRAGKSLWRLERIAEFAQFNLLPQLTDCYAVGCNGSFMPIWWYEALSIMHRLVRVLETLTSANWRKQGAEAKLCSFKLLIFQIQLVPLIVRVEVVSVNDVVASFRCWFEYLVRLAVVSLQKFFEVEVGKLVLWRFLLWVEYFWCEHQFFGHRRLRTHIIVMLAALFTFAMSAVRLLVALPYASQTLRSFAVIYLNILWTTRWNHALSLVDKSWWIHRELLGDVRIAIPASKIVKVQLLLRAVLLDFKTAL